MSQYSEVPYNFSWIVAGNLAAMACPATCDNLRYLESQGIRHLITLSPERKPPMHLAPDLLWTVIPVKEFEPPTMEQIQQFVSICQDAESKNMAIGVHCRQGLGRTGVMAACYLLSHYNDDDAGKVIATLRHGRPYSIETEEQEVAVFKYSVALRAKTSTIATR